ncbi:hypothetical protein BU24DRAFT_411950 [Aaosphaeria arxii CBS 175.79]|uniref:SnoaL-like domain-containing protein n=1 Tax=Aaosphaeria arxii CBS 175.79 TaxID=1450172 RepID=A0A6A5XI23_9PLEO|nr:uncharacterized protein BU24DRAFT_411950 [Aaosphaeria arxii CBS 175.79]KAF2012603.1 hypothetical protein BU24DRAFT_411950 [Aaosphaeria arxii CBS 175.79]
MHIPTLFTTTLLLLLPTTTVLAHPVTSSTSPSSPLEARQSRPTKPKPCVSIANTTEAQHLANHAKFTDAFIVKKNITAAFEFIRQDYINHNPAAQNGFDSAWNILSPIWSSQSITPLRNTYRHPQGWLNYRSGSFGEVVDRFRWDGGCIAEHWDQGERYPTK